MRSLRSFIAFAVVLMAALSAQAATRRAQAQRLLQRWQHDPVRFVEDVPRLRMWSRQEEIARAVDRHSRIAVRSGHKIGKSTSACGTALWWVNTRPRARVVMTSASFRQVKSILWKELRRISRRSKWPLGGDLALDPETGWQFPDGREIVGLSTREPEKIAGYSGDNLLFILDEASGIPQEIFEAIEGNRAGGARLIMYSNPTQTSGEFYDAFHSKRQYYHCIHISSEETPNATGIGEPIPGLANADWIAEKRTEWGEESSLYQVRVRGNFPLQASDAVVSLFLVEVARRRFNEEEVSDSAPLELGVDPARSGGDEFAIAPIRGKLAYPQRTFQNLDGPTGAGKILEVVRELRRKGERPLVKIDIIGVGASVYDALKVSEEVEVIPVNVAEAPTVTAEGEPKFHRLRDQLWFGIRRWLKEGGAIAEDSRLEAELVAPTYGFTGDAVKVESKDSMKKRLGRSPDRADALCLAVYRAPGAAEWEPVFGGSRWS